MLFDSNTLRSLNFYNLLSSLLVKEAAEEGVQIFLDYYSIDKGYDAYYPYGTKLFGFGDRLPVIVEFKKTVDTITIKQVLEYASQKQHVGHFVFLCFDKKISEDKLSAYEGLFGIKVFDMKFIQELANKHSDVVINTLLAQPDTIISKNTNAGEKEPEYVLIDKKKQKNYLLHGQTPEEMSDIHESKFKSFLYDDGKKSNCAIIIGNGVSIPFGSDSWSDMIDNMVDHLKPYYISNIDHIKSALSDSSYAISSFVKVTLDSDGLIDKYYNAIYYCIYRKFNELMLDQPSLVRNIARGKLKYYSMPVLTYNYDTFVEKAYEKISGSYLYYYSSKDNKYSPDIAGLFPDHLIHLHGYLSYSAKKKENIILTDEDYFKAYLDNHSSWVRKTQVDVLQNYKCLFVGSSMSDVFQMSVIADVKKKKGQNWNCFALMCFEGLTSNEKLRIIKHYQEKGINIIFVNTFSELPDKLEKLLKL